jgi:hypothetical protein
LNSKGNLRYQKPQNEIALLTLGSLCEGLLQGLTPPGVVWVCGGVSWPEPLPLQSPNPQGAILGWSLFSTTCFNDFQLRLLFWLQIDEEGVVVVLQGGTKKSIQKLKF